MAEPAGRKKAKGVRVRNYLVISDLHEGFEEAKAIGPVAKSEKFDAVINLGDYIADWHTDQKELIERTSRQLAPLAGQNVIAIPGNHDNAENLRTALSQYKGMHDIHGKSYAEGGGIGYVGFGGSEKSRKSPNVPAALDRAHYAPKEFTDSLQKSFEHLYNENKVEPKDAMLVLHTPMRGIFDLANSHYTGNKIRIGSSAIEKVVNDRDPGVILSGHCHDDYGACIRVRKKDSNPAERRYATLRLDDLDAGSHSLLGVKIDVEHTGKSRGVYNVSYDLNDSYVNTFLNPGSLGYEHSYAKLRIADDEANHRRNLRIEFSKL